LNQIFDVARSVHVSLKATEIPHVFIGGLAVLAWGEVRVTNDVDLSVLCRFGFEEPLIDTLLTLFPNHDSTAKEFALQNRVLLAKSETGIGIDIGLAGFPYEEEALGRARTVEISTGVSLPLVSPEDLIVMKTFAGRPRDWLDVRTILIRQRKTLDWSIVHRALPELLELIEEPERWDRLVGERDQITAEFG
jgi:hypothetical protein